MQSDESRPGHDKLLFATAMHFGQIEHCQKQQPQAFNHAPAMVTSALICLNLMQQDVAECNKAHEVITTAELQLPAAMLSSTSRLTIL